MPRKHTASDMNLHDACLAEARAIIAERGVDSLSLREVARRLGVSHQAPYRHFESREHILAELIVMSLTGFAAALNGRPHNPDPYRDMEAIGRAYFSYAEADPLGYQLMFGSALLDPDSHPGLAEAGKQAFDIVKTATARLPGNAQDPDQAERDALFAWSTVHGVVSLMQSHAIRVQGHTKENVAALQDTALQRISQAFDRR